MDNESQQIDPRIQRTLHRLRSRIRLFVWVEGLSLAIVWLGVMFWLGLAADYLPVLAGANELAQGARAVLLIIVGGVLAYILYRFVGQRAFVQFNVYHTSSSALHHGLRLRCRRRAARRRDDAISSLAINGELGSGAGG